MMIPQYLRALISRVKERRGKLTLSVCCSCGCNTFTILQNERPEKDVDFPQVKEIVRSRDTSGEEILLLKDKFGRPKQIVPIDDVIDELVYVVYAKCSNCGTDSVIFDNRRYGYHAMFFPNPAEEDLALIPITITPHQIEIVIINEFTYEEFIEESETEVSEDEYSNAFSYIGIYSITRRVRKLIFEEETD